MPAKMEKKPDRMQNPNDQDRKLESGLGSHCRSTSALTPNMITDIVMKAAGKQQQNIRLIVLFSKNCLIIIIHIKKEKVKILS